MTYLDGLAESLLDPSEPDLLLSQPDVSPGKNLAKARRPAAGRPARSSAERQDSESDETPDVRPLGSFRRQASRRPLAKLATKARSKPASKPLPKLAAKPAAKVARAPKPASTAVLRPVAVAPVAPPAPPPSRRSPASTRPSRCTRRGVRGAAAARLRRRRRILPSGPPALSRRAGAHRTRPAVPAGLRARDGPAASRTADDGREGLRGDDGAERR